MSPPCHRARTTLPRSCGTGRARTQTPLPRWHDSPAVHPRGLAGAARRTRASTSRPFDALCPRFTWGVFAPNCRLRARIVPSARSSAARQRRQGRRPDASTPPNPPGLNDEHLRIAPMIWAPARPRPQRSRPHLADIATSPHRSCGRYIRIGLCVLTSSGQRDQRNQRGPTLMPPSTTRATSAPTPRSHSPAEPFRQPVRGNPLSGTRCAAPGARHPVRHPARDTRCECPWLAILRREQAATTGVRRSPMTLTAFCASTTAVASSIGTSRRARTSRSLDTNQVQNPPIQLPSLWYWHVFKALKDHYCWR